MPAPIIYWQPSNIPSEIQSELNRRKVNRSFAFVNNQPVTANWDSNTGDWNSYRGPMVSWVRLCSNSEGRVDSNGNPIKPRFVLHSGKGFYDSYGFQPRTSYESQFQVIGYTPEGIKHVIDNDLNSTTPGGNFPIHVPPPEISRIDVTVQKELFRRANIEWVCFSWKQLEYLTPYFLIPGITVMLEWGWNHFNPASLVQLDNVVKMASFWENSYPLYSDNIIRSKGNYDVTYGIVTNFKWEIQGSRIICSTEITSKDRLYAGISKGSDLTVKHSSEPEEPDWIYQSIESFLKKDDTWRAIKDFANTSSPLKKLQELIVKNPKYEIWQDILSPLLTRGKPEIIAMRTPYVYGVFSGRQSAAAPSGQYGSGVPGAYGGGYVPQPPPTPTQTSTATIDYNDFGQPVKGDFDKTGETKDPNKLWINMGMVVEILNHFSDVPGGGNGKTMFKMDIQNTVIGGHPNMISCDPRVLIPNAMAPKYHYGSIGMTNFGTGSIGMVSAFFGATGESEYGTQWARPTPVSLSGSLANQQLSKVCYQRTLPPPAAPERAAGRFAPESKSNKNCYRNDLNVVINRLREKWITTNKAFGDWRFPATEPIKLPESINGLPGNMLMPNFSGLLSNIYIRYDAFRDCVLNGLKIKTTPETFMDIYRDILQVLMDASDGFWDLAVVEAENTMTITDKKYIGSSETMGPDPMYVFDYYDSDSIIKSIKFAPQLSDAQATRAIYGEINNKASKVSISDKNDLLDYKFKDFVNFNKKDRTQGEQNDLDSRKTAQRQMKDLIATIQNINSGDGDDGTLQMTFHDAKVAPYNTIPANRKEVIKLVLPNPQILRMLLDDKDEENNARYCAVQPGIVLELTLQGIGGIRTFQYFLVKNLPEPYSHKNIIFRVTNVQHNLESGNWDTVIQAQPIPLRKYITSRVRGPEPNGWPPDNKS